MENIVISLPNSQRIYVEEQIRLGNYSNASEYFSILVQQDRERQAKQRLETILHRWALPTLRPSHGS